MKKIVSIVLIFAIVLCFAACSSNTDTGAKQALNDGLVALKNFDTEGISKYFVDGELNEEDLAATGADQAKAIFASFSWDIKRCVENGDSATATVDLTSVSLAGVVSEVVTELMDELMAGNVTNDTTEEFVKKRMDEMLKDPNAPTATMTISITLKNVDGQWKISNPHAIVAMLSLGLEGIVGSAE